ncbi:hypothetical protein Bbelb_393310 [Branchiostoma belcheri]|nr:hypothetical protein Bbelb_393310 [Branchiostoma belcheri]
MSLTEVFEIEQWIRCVRDGPVSPLDPARDLTAARPNCKSRSAPYHTPHGSRWETEQAPNGSLKRRSQPAVHASACCLRAKTVVRKKHVRVRPPYGKVAIAQRSCVVSTYNSLTTCATYNARNRSRPDVTCRPHSYTLQNRASDVRRCHSFRTFSEKNVAHVASQKTYGQKARTVGCDRRLTEAGRRGDQTFTNINWKLPQRRPEYSLAPTGSRKGSFNCDPDSRQTLGVMTPAGVYAVDMPNGRRFKCDLSFTAALS